MIKNNKEIEMVERMARLEIDVSYIKKSIDLIRDNMKLTNTKLDGFVEAVDKKYALKEVEHRVEEHDKAINKINVTIAKYVGGAIVVSALITWLINIYL